MPRRRLAEDLTVDELRQLLIDKRRSQRQKRIDVYRRTGRVILVEQAPIPPSLDTLHTIPLEETSAAEENASTPSRSKAWRVFLDRLLFLIEFAAVIGLGYILFNGVQVLQSLNHEVAAVLVQPTTSPTPIISAVVLPSGHIPPVNGVTRFNDSEIPEHLRPLVQSMAANVTFPTPSPEHAVNIKIPAIHVLAPIVQGDGWEQLKKGVGQHIGSVNPGQAGNVVLSAHNDVFGELFRDLDKLKPGDEITLYTEQKAYTYKVRQAQIVDPTSVEVMAPTHEAVVTLISCYPYLVDNKRIVIIADLVNQ